MPRRPDKTSAKLTEGAVVFVIVTRTGTPPSRHNALGEILVPFGLFFSHKNHRPQAFTGKRCGLGVLAGRKTGAKKETRRNTESLLLKASG